MSLTTEDYAHRITQLNCASVTKPTLVYFDIVGIGWPIRCLLHINSIDYEHIPIPIQHWDRLKSLFPNGHVPYYVDSDIALSQSNPILTYLAEKHGMAGSSPTERFAILEVMGHAYDALFHWNGLLQVIVTRGLSADVVEARRRSFMGDGVWGIVTNGYANHLDGFRHYLNANKSNSGYFVGDSLTVADLHAFNLLCNWYKGFARERFIAEYPDLEAFVQRIGALPAIRDYIRTKQEKTAWLPLPQIAIAMATPDYLRGLLDN